MFIGGLNWETTDRKLTRAVAQSIPRLRRLLNFLLESLKDYFSQFGEVLDCTVMRDGSTGRSRGFGFLTFKDPKTVNIVMVKEHYLDGKIVRTAISRSKNGSHPRKRRKTSSSRFESSKIDPKRAIPRDEQERTSKIFVGGVSQEATEQEFREFFMQFGRVLDATLMIDKDTGRPRGFGFVTFDSEAAVESALSQPLEIHGKAIEVKKAQPRGNVRDGDDDRSDRRFNRRGRDGHDRFDRDNHRHSGNSDHDQDKGQGSGQNQQAGQGLYAGMTPQMMAQYWQRMQQYFAMMQQQMAAAQNQGMANPMVNPMAMAAGALNPAMLQQITALQTMSRQSSQGTQSPQSPDSQAMQGMNPAMMQQIQQMQQLQQMQQQQAQVQQQASFGGGMPGGGNMGGFTGGRSGPGYNAYEQQLFEQRKYEQQQARRAAREPQQAYPQQFQGGPTSWEGMYDDVPQPNMGMQQGFQRQMTPNQGQGGGNRQHNRGSQGPSTSAPQSTAPANAPTGPKNAGKPGANYRGGRGGNRFHPYSRP